MRLVHDGGERTTDGGLSLKSRRKSSVRIVQRDTHMCISEGVEAYGSVHGVRVYQDAERADQPSKRNKMMGATLCGSLNERSRLVTWRLPHTAEREGTVPDAEKRPRQPSRTHPSCALCRSSLLSLPAFPKMAPPRTQPVPGTQKQDKKRKRHARCPKLKTALKQSKPRQLLQPTTHVYRRWHCGSRLR